MPANYVLLQKITVGAAGASSVTFSSIPQTGYTDLVVKCSTRRGGASVYGDLVLGFNNDTSAVYSNKRLNGSGSSASSAGNTSVTYAELGNSVGDDSTANTFGSTEIYIPNYTSNNYKSFSVDVVGENNAIEAYTNLISNIWSQTSAITSIKLSSGNASNILANSTFYLYGVAALGTTPAIAPYATGGDTITTDGNYWYHTFNSSGTFTPRKALTCDYLVVAGGGGGGDGAGATSGGGGAGGLRSTVTATGGGGSLETALSLTAQAYTVTIGAGGPGVVHSAPFGNGTNGSNSVFSTITSTGGGGGGGYSTVTSADLVGNAGGSGGGAGNATAGGAGTANQGFAGGSDGTNNLGSGGGGAGEVGSTDTAGHGGDGVAVSISGSSVTYAGGGGGGSVAATAQRLGGDGGGGNGQRRDTTVGTAGTANTGGGGGGSLTVASYAGGSGIVIVRYPI